ncbi:MAG: hypothetical protein L0387_16685 [Acidobacteria bacterium]|nr:hypothetical protein [Acidobacteriota bacterium]MCI0623267.1 hypothetical protein [Acidobacteriota bacterium]
MCPLPLAYSICLSLCTLVLLCHGARPLFAQQRPLQTQEPAILAPGNVSLQFGFDFFQEAKYPLSGLRGDLTSLGVIGIYAGLGEIVEFQMQGSVYDFLSINKRSATPLDLTLNTAGTATSDFGDLSLSTKILLAAEKKHFPALAFRPTVQLPNASAAKGLGLDSTQFYGTLLAGKHFGKLNAFANAGLGILGNPVEAGVQNDVVVYGLGGIYPVSPALSLASEVYGRWSTRQSGTPLGTESQSQFRLGVQIHGLGFRWDIAGVAGLADNSPNSGISFGVTKEFRAFRIGGKKN